jgi:hypothetical protein
MKTKNDKHSRYSRTSRLLTRLQVAQVVLFLVLFTLGNIFQSGPLIFLSVLSVYVILAIVLCICMDNDRASD